MDDSTILEPVKIPTACGECAKTVQVSPLVSGAPSLPRGWLEIDAARFCADCKERLFVTRTISVPVASVAVAEKVDWSPEACKLAWRAFRPVLKAARVQAAQVCNAMLFELARLDCLPLTHGTATTRRGQELAVRTLPRLSVTSAAALKRLYDLGREQFPELDSQSMCSLRQKVWARYHDRQRGRFQIRVLGTVSLPTFRDSVPVPIPAKDATLRFSREHQRGAPLPYAPGTSEVYLTLRLQGQRFVLRLRGGRDMRRQLALLELIEAGQAKLGEVSLREQASFNANGRNGGSSRAAPEGPRRNTRVMAGISVTHRKKFGERLDRTLTVVSTAESLWEVSLSGERLWLLHDDFVRRRIAAHRTRLQRFADDQKFERRRPRRERNYLNASRAEAVERHKRWLDSSLHKMSAMLLGLLKRQKACRLVYDDRCKSWCELFPWFKLWSMVEAKASAIGITAERICTSEENGDAEILD